ncbi:hypothetical protein GCM10022295_22800 [Streptomyces osmaniensis]|uniref:Uncharacterized protein n=1 Tax=Streptomyces osmaniensis TaxID=593134 RepID=A0ABP6VRB4_9ACTN
MKWDPGNILDSTPAFRDLWDREGGVPGYAADSSSVLPWVSGCNANELGWLMLDSDPDNWPVVAWRRRISYGNTRWKLFDCGMVDFLVKTMRAEFDECPLGDASSGAGPLPLSTGESSSDVGLQASTPRMVNRMPSCRASYSGRHHDGWPVRRLAGVRAIGSATGRMAQVMRVLA